jgi:N-acetylglutamate synthase-like GNAT family acetyltransferase
MNPVTRLANDADVPKLQQLDPWPKERIWKQKIMCNEVVVLELNSEVIGLIRYDLLWTTVPFIGLIEIEEVHRGKGYSRVLLELLKQHLREQGYVALLSSSQTDESTPQNWHRHTGFKSNGIIENIMDEDVGEIVYRLML